MLKGLKNVGRDLRKRSSTESETKSTKSRGKLQLRKTVTVNLLTVGDQRCANNDLVEENMIEGPTLY